MIYLNLTAPQFTSRLRIDPPKQLNPLFLALFLKLNKTLAFPQIYLLVIYIYLCSVQQISVHHMIRGTNHDQDARFADKTKKMLEKSQWPDKYDIKIDLKKVDYQLIKVWIEKRLIKLLGEEDDIVSGTIISHLDEALEKQEKVNAKHLHVAISGVLQEKTLTFMSDLWDILDEAQRSSRGIPECLVEEKKNSQDTHRRKLDELQQKRHKMNLSKFNQTTRGKYDYKASDEPREREDRELQKKKKHRDRRSRSKSQTKKHSRSREKKRHERSRDKPKREKERRRSRSRSGERKERKKQKKRERSEESDSSGVVSSSNSGN